MPKLLTRTELSKELKCSLPTIDRLKRNGMPCLSNGGMLRYDLDEVIQWLKEGDK